MTYTKGQNYLNAQSVTCADFAVVEAVLPFIL